MTSGAEPEIRSKETNKEWEISDGGKENTAEELCQYSGWTAGGRLRNRSSIAAGGRDFFLPESVHGCQRLFPRRYNGPGVRQTTNLNVVSRGVAAQLGPRRPQC
jgi:hypothetical protein